VENEVVLHLAKEESNSIQKINRRECKLIGNFMPGNCLMKHVLHRKKDGSLEVVGRKRRRRKQLEDDLN
jgi:hypothetical protein